MPGLLTREEIQERQFFYINEWLILDKYKDLTSHEYASLQLKIIKLLTEYAFNTNAYSGAEPTLFARKTLMNPLFIEDPKVNKVYILSRSLGETQRESKEKFIEKYFSHDKIEVIHIGPTETKGSVLKSRGISWNVFIDDELPNLRNVAELFTDLQDREFIIPRYGYNKMPKDLKFLIEARGGKITYFEPFGKK